MTARAAVGARRRLASDSTLPFWSLAAAALALLGVIAAWRAPGSPLRGDEGTYVAMTASLARDGDLAFDERDAAWAAGHAGEPATVILQRTAAGVVYSKPVLYPLLAWPFYAVAGEAGMVALNFLALVGGLCLLRAFLARIAPPGAATATVLTFAGAAIVLAYLPWRMSEMLQLALAAAGLALALARERPATRPAGGRLVRWLEHPYAAPTGGALLGLLVALREPHAAVALVPVGAAAMAGRWGRAARMAGVAAVSYLGVLALTWALTGALNPYKAPRATFNAETGYPAGERRAELLHRFEDEASLATSSISARPVLRPAMTAYSSLYFLIGRHSGLLLYFPAALVLLAATLRRPDRLTVAALAGFFGLAVFYLVWWPSNYFGGETFLGNRYVLAAYPCLLVGLARAPARRGLLVAWAIAAGAGVSALISVTRAGALDATSQSHAHAGAFRWLPYESTASNIDGRRDRYWSDDFLRFVDPYARADAWSFELTAGMPAAEVELATAWAGDPTTWLVRSDAARATLVVADWRGTRRYPLASFPGGSGGPVTVDLAPAWRVHPFWWSAGEPARARLIRLALETDPDHPQARATVRYLGRRALPETFARAVDAAPLPASAAAGETTSITLRLRNLGDWTWRSDDALTTQVGVRLAPAGGGAPSENRVPLPLAVEPGRAVDVEVPIAWPAAAGRVRATVDLVLEDVAWFGDRTGAPLAEGVVEVLATEPPPARSGRRQGRPRGGVVQVE